MALTDEQKNILATGGQYAGYGAAIGAPIGGPVGAAIGAGVGGVVGMGTQALLGSKQSEYDIYRQEQIDELKRRQELGLLGLTDEERANLQAQLVDPIRAAQRQQQLQYAGAMTGMGGQASDAARLLIGQEQRVAEQMQPALTEIARADLAKARYEEQQLQALLREQDKQQQAEEQYRQQQIMSGLMTAGKAVGAYAAAEGEAAAKEQEYRMLLAMIQGGGGAATTQNAAGTDALYQSIYGTSPVGK